MLLVASIGNLSKMDGRKKHQNLLGDKEFETWTKNKTCTESSWNLPFGSSMQFLAVLHRTTPVQLEQRIISWPSSKCFISITRTQGSCVCVCVCVWLTHKEPAWCRPKIQQNRCAMPFEVLRLRRCLRGMSWFNLCHKNEQSTIAYNSYIKHNL